MLEGHAEQEPQNPQFLVKEDGKDTRRIGVEDYLSRVTKNLSNEGQKRALEETARKIIGGLQSDTDFCLFSNEVGHELTLQKQFMAATEAYQFSFDEEDPYDFDRSIYASNLLRSVNQFIYNHDPNTLVQDREWLKGKRAAIKQATVCLAYMKDHEIFKEAYKQTKSVGFEIDWDQKPQLVPLLKDLENMEKVGNGILKILNPLD